MVSLADRLIGGATEASSRFARKLIKRKIGSNYQKVIRGGLDGNLHGGGGHARWLEKVVFEWSATRFRGGRPVPSDYTLSPFSEFASRFVHCTVGRNIRARRQRARPSESQFNNRLWDLIDAAFLLPYAGVIDFGLSFHREGPRAGCEKGPGGWAHRKQREAPDRKDHFLGGQAELGLAGGVGSKRDFPNLRGRAALAPKGQAWWKRPWAHLGAAVMGARLSPEGGRVCELRQRNFSIGRLGSGHGPVIGEGQGAALQGGA